MNQIKKINCNHSFVGRVYMSGGVGGVYVSNWIDGPCLKYGDCLKLVLRNNPIKGGHRINHLMVDFETIIALPSITYIADLDAYELYFRDSKIFNNFIDVRVL